MSKVKAMLQDLEQIEGRLLSELFNEIPELKNFALYTSNQILGIGFINYDYLPNHKFLYLDLDDNDLESWSQSIEIKSWLLEKNLTVSDISSMVGVIRRVTMIKKMKLNHIYNRENV